MYPDSGGNTWAGRGPRPAWLIGALCKEEHWKDFDYEGGI